MALVEAERRRVVRVQSCVRRWVASRVACRRRELQHTHATRIQAGND